MGIGWAQGVVLPLSLLGFFLAITIAGLAIQVGSCCLLSNSQPAVLRRLYRLGASWQQLRAVRGITVRLWGLTVALTAVAICQAKLAFSAVSLDISWSGLIVYAASKNLAVLVGVTPGGFGIVEGISIYLGQVFNYSTSTALIVQGLIRTVSYTALLLIGPLSVWGLKRQLEGCRKPPRPVRETATPEPDLMDKRGPESPSGDDGFLLNEG
jgi:uncharacterized membrane protein YbhN (UPF0104 family)